MDEKQCMQVNTGVCLDPELILHANVAMLPLSLKALLGFVCTSPPSGALSLAKWRGFCPAHFLPELLTRAESNG